MFLFGRMWMMVVAFLVLLLAHANAPAQHQPADATNAQDEVVNIVKQVAPETADFTIFRTGDKAERNNYISEVIELEHAAAIELLPYVLRAVRLEKGTTRALKYTDPETRAERYFLQVITTHEQMPSVLETIRALDMPGVVSSQGDVKYHYRLNYRRASEVAALLADTTLSSETGKVSFDDGTNTIYFQDGVYYARRNIEVIKFYDVPPPQVEFEVTVVEIEADKAGKLGLDWDAWKESLGGQFEFVGNIYEGGDRFGRLDALMTVDPRAFASFLNYTVTSGTADVVTRTLLVASNDTPAVFSSLRRIPSASYVTVFSDAKVLTESAAGMDARSKGERTDPPGQRPVVITPPSRSILTRTSLNPAAPGASAQDPSLINIEKAEGIYLVIQPTIGREMITAELRVVVNSLSGMSNLGEPIISERLLTTRVTLKHDEPFGLGGLAKDTSVTSTRGIPLLKSIPVLGTLFKAETTRVSQSKVYILIRPRIQSQMRYQAPSLEGSRLESGPVLVGNEQFEVLQLPAGLEAQPALLHEE